MRVNWDDLRIFLAVARTGTLGAAARALKQTQPTIGRRVRALETALGQALFQRTTDGFVLTDEGAAVFGHVERMEEEATAFERGLAGQAGQIEGILRVSTSDWFATHALGPIFTRFSLAHPGVTLEVITDTRLMSLARREADLLFRFGKFDEADVIQRKAVHLDYGLYGSKTYLKKRPPLATGNGEGHVLIAMDVAFEKFADVVWLKRMLPKAHFGLRSNNREVQLMFCKQGGGLAVLPRLMADKVADLAHVDLGEPPPGRDVWAGYHRDMRRLPRLRALLDAIYASSPFTAVGAISGAAPAADETTPRAKRPSKRRR